MKNIFKRLFIAFISKVESYWLWLTCLILLIITIGSLYPMEQLPSLPGNDKTRHLIGYCALMLPVAIRQPKHWLGYAILFIIWSGVIELIQPYVNRYGEWADMLANSVGVLIAIILGILLKKIKEKYS